MHLKRRALTSAGDTIVEVMIVLAVLGLAISISYATAHASLAGARQAQENSYANQVLQSQLEYARANVGTAAGNFIFHDATYCVDPVGGLQHGSAARCIDSSHGFDLKYWVTRSSPSGQNDTFTARATWPDIQGDGNDNVTLVERIHQ